MTDPPDLNFDECKNKEHQLVSKIKDDQDGHFFFNHPERGGYFAA